MADNLEYDPRVRNRDRSLYTDKWCYDEALSVPEKLALILQQKGMIARLTKLMLKYRPGKFVQLHPTYYGSFNCCFHMELEDGHVAMRIPLPENSVDVERKVHAEAAVMRLVAEKTSIPVPTIYHCGTGRENPTGLGPFIIMDYIQHERTMADLLQAGAAIGSPGPVPAIDQNLPPGMVRRIYGQMANILLQLDKLTMPRAGMLRRDSSPSSSKRNKYAVSGMPMTQNLTDVVVFGGMPSYLLDNRSYSSSFQFYSAQADLHMAHFLFQQETAVDSKDDAKDKYMARFLFRRLWEQGKIIHGVLDGVDDLGAEKFKLICDDLSPNNVLLDENNNVVGIIDWEFAYFGPEPIASSPPWWLLLEKPELWHAGFHDWIELYPTYLELFLEALKLEEAKATTLQEKTHGNMTKSGDDIASKIEAMTISHASPFDIPDSRPATATTTKTTKSLSQRMRASWDTGSFWISWASRRSFGFDAVFWNFLDERYFGPNEKGGYEGRVMLLTREEREIMDYVAHSKMVDGSQVERRRWHRADSRMYLKALTGRSRV